jgi:acyl-CoA hydrolase
MVAVDEAFCPIPVPRLLVETEDQYRRWQDAEERRRARLALAEERRRRRALDG